MNISKKDIITIPNLLTFSRLIFGLIFAYGLFFDYSSIFLFIVLFIACLTDFFDGFLARKLNQESKIGSLLDSNVDRIFFATIILSLLIYTLMNRGSFIYFSYFSYIYLAILILIPREILCLIGVFINLLRGKKIYVSSALIGRITGLFQYLTILSIVLNLNISFYFAILVFIFGITSGLNYIRNSLHQ